MLMKRSLFVAALATLAAGSALAQSNVTIWGRLNETVEREKVGGVSRTVLNDNASRLGFKGTEDLGGGLSANFLIEHRFGPDTGAAASPFWAGQSEVNLTSKSLGAIRLGRFTSEAYFATADYVSMHNHDTGTSADALYYSAAGFASNNRIGYASPEFVPGLVFHASVGLHETAATPNYRDFAVNYTLGGLALGAGYDAQGVSNQFALRALYSFGPFAVGGYFQQADDAADGKRNNFRLAGMYTLGASEFHLHAGMAGDWKNIAGDSGAKQYTLAYNYNLSKRTKVYTYFTKLSADTNANETDYQSFALGVRHNF
jgi:predicted porin